MTGIRGDVTVFEGPDGAGKTTLVQAFLRTHRGAEMIASGPPKGDPMAELLGVLARHPGTLALDRFHLGEQVYGPVHRGGDGLGRRGRLVVEAALAHRRTVVVLCIPPWERCREVWAARAARGGEMFTDEPKHRRVWELFQEARTDLPVVYYDWTERPGFPLDAIKRISAKRLAAYPRR